MPNKRTLIIVALSIIIFTSLFLSIKNNSKKETLESNNLSDMETLAEEIEIPTYSSEF